MKKTLIALLLMLSTSAFTQKIDATSNCEVIYNVIRDTAFQIDKNEILEKIEINLDNKTVEMFKMSQDSQWVSVYGIMKIKDSTINFKRRNGGFVEVFCPDTKKTLVIWLNSRDNKFELYKYWKNESLVYYKECLTVNFK